MNILMISPGYPGEMPHFTKALAARGARVIGLGDQPGSSLPADVRGAVAAHVFVRDLWDESAVIRQVLQETSGLRIDRVECLWEPAMILAARLREALGTPGLDVARTVPFRDKERMKQVLDAAGIRTPWHRRARTLDQCRAAATECGFPVIVKPIAGAGSTDTYRIDSSDELEQILPRLLHVAEVSVEEFIDGEEFTYDTICANGRIGFENVAFYIPRPIEEKKHAWISPSSTCVRDIDRSDLRGGVEMGRAVLKALEFETGFSHMEWYRKADGEVVFGEIAARPPGGRMVDAMNFACDIDLFAGWAEAVCHGTFTQPVRRRYNSTIVCKRAEGQGRIRGVEGLDRLLSELGEHVVAVDINPVGTPRGDWQRAATADGYMIVRHPELQTTLAMAARVARELRIFAG